MLAFMPELYGVFFFNLCRPMLASTTLVFLEKYGPAYLATPICLEEYAPPYLHTPIFLEILIEKGWSGWLEKGWTGMAGARILTEKGWFRWLGRAFFEKKAGLGITGDHVVQSPNLQQICLR